MKIKVIDEKGDKERFRKLGFDIFKGISGILLMAIAFCNAILFGIGSYVFGTFIANNNVYVNTGVFLFALMILFLDIVLCVECAVININAKMPCKCQIDHVCKPADKK
jgi:hypothetical protein